MTIRRLTAISLLLVAAPAHSKGDPSAGIERANRAASYSPRSDAFVNARQVYPWSDGAIYEVSSAPGRISEIALQPGENLVSVAAGDTARWIIGDTTSGSGDVRRTHLLIKPVAPGLSTNLLIATDRRTYHLVLTSRSGGAMTSMAWTYPHDALLALRKAAAAAEAAPPAAPSVAVERLNFHYAMQGDRPSWRPLRAFDDGRQVFIQFPPSLAQGDAPPLFVLGAKGEAQLVNYRLRGHYYVVDRLFERAELRLGEKRQQIVRIVRLGHRS